jgi:YegS/Rv2252/BmrU family lipid kinase
VRLCVIFNPVARGNKARRFRDHLAARSAQCAFLPTAGPGDARRLARAAVEDGFDLIVAAGGDGTVNEVLNGIGDTPDGFLRARLGVLPLGTINVFARELNLPLQFEAAWAVLQRGHEMKMDLGRADFQADGRAQQRYFMQLAGVGFDARAIELVSWKLKQKAGPLAYVAAGFQALAETKPRLIVSADGRQLEGELALIGNGKFYGGPYPFFPDASLCSGRLEVCVFPRMNLGTLLQLAPGFLARRKLSGHQVRRGCANRLEVTGDRPAAFELDGEWIANLPVTFSVAPQKLLVMVP